VTSATISNYFRKAGFKKIISQTNEEARSNTEEVEDCEDFAEWSELGINGITFEEFISIDENLTIAENMTDGEILELVTHEDSDEDEKDDDESDVDNQCDSKISVSRAAQLLTELRQFAQQQENVPEEMFKMIDYFEEFCEKVPRKQSTLDKFFISQKDK